MKNKGNAEVERGLLFAAVAAALILVVFMTPSFGQKEDLEVKRATSRDGLLAIGFMTKPELSDELDGNDDEYFYKFQAGPGKLTVLLEVVANETNAGATLDLFGSNSKAILSNLLAQGADGGSERVSKSVNLAKAQDIIIRIKGLKYGSDSSYPGVYKIRFEGTAVNFAEPVPSEGPVQVMKPDVAPSDAPVEVIKPDAAPSEGTVEVIRPDTAPTDGSVEIKKPDAAAPDETGSDKKPTATAPDKTVENKKPDAVDRVIEKGKAKSNRLLELLNKVKTKIPD